MRWGSSGGSANTAETATSARTAQTATSAPSQNDQAIANAEQSEDNQAQMGAAAIRKVLEKKIGLNSEGDFDLDHQIEAGQIGGDCYVKLGAEATNFQDQTENILRSPNGRDLVFVQSSTSTPLVKCLKAVRAALAW